MATCGTSNANPTMFVTLTWSGGGSTKDYLGCTWTSGETKEVYSTTYTQDASPNILKEEWEAKEVFDRIQLVGKDNTNYTSYASCMIFVHYNGLGSPNNFYRKEYTYFNSNNLSAYQTSGYNFNLVEGYPIHANMKSGSLSGASTSTNGLTISWAEGNGW